MIERLRDWSSRLVRFIAERRRMPFQWGTNDCALFAADAVAAMTGVDVASEFRGKYADEDGAWAALKAHGYRTQSDVASAYFESIPPAQARVGDVVAIKGSGALGVVVGEMVAVLRPDGLGMLPLSEARRAYRV